MLKVCSGVTNERETGCLVGLVGRAEIDRSYAMNEVSNPKLELEEGVSCLCLEGAHPLL